MKLILLAAGLLAIAFAGIAIKIWAKKNGEFAGTCAGNSPLLKTDNGSCTVCGALPSEQCKKD